jgi:hypothetical protein
MEGVHKGARAASVGAICFCWFHVVLVFNSAGRARVQLSQWMRSIGDIGNAGGVRTAGMLKGFGWSFCAAMRKWPWG